MSDSPELVRQMHFGYETAVYDVITWLTDHDYQDAANAAEEQFCYILDGPDAA